MTENSGLAGRNEIQAFQLPLGLRHDFCGGMRRFEPGPQLDGLGARLAFAKFALNGLHLLAQIRASLCLRKLGRQILLQLLLDLGNLKLRGDVRLHSLDAFGNIEFLEESLFLRGSTFRLVARKSASCPPSVMFIRTARA